MTGLVQDRFDAALRRLAQSPTTTSSPATEEDLGLIRTMQRRLTTNSLVWFDVYALAVFAALSSLLVMPVDEIIRGLLVVVFLCWAGTGLLSTSLRWAHVIFEDAHGVSVASVRESQNITRLIDAERIGRKRSQT